MSSKQASLQSHHVSNSQRQIHRVIHSIIQKGGDDLYQKYIMRKIPQHTSQKIAILLDQTMKPMHFKLNQIQNNFSQLPPENTNTKTNIRNYQKQIKEVTKSLNYEITNRKKNLTFRDKDEQKIIKNNVVKIQISSDQNPEQFEEIWKQKTKNEQQLKEKRYLASRLWQQKQNNSQRLQNDLKLIEQKGGDIPFDYETCTIIPIDANDLKRTENIRKSQPKQLLFTNSLTYQLSQGKSQHRKPEEMFIVEKRNLSSGGSRRKSINQDEVKSDYNNNGKRQFSSISYIQPQVGIKITELPKNISTEKKRYSGEKRYEPHQIHKFKSFIIEQFEKDKLYKTLDCKFDKIATQQKMVSMKNTTRPQTVKQIRRSILWRSQSKDVKEQKVISNQKLVDSCLF